MRGSQPWEREVSQAKAIASEKTRSRKVNCVFAQKGGTGHSRMNAKDRGKKSLGR